MFVVIGNPPYNASQANENDNNQKPAPTKAVDNRVRATYAAASTAQLKSKTLRSIRERAPLGIR